MTISVMSKCLRSENEVRETGYMDSVKQTPLSRWDAEFFQNKQLGLLPRFGAYIIQNVYDFDFRLFGATNHEYSAVEPRQRLVLLVAAETFFCFRSKRLEKPLDIKSRAGIYVGCSWNDFELLCRETGLQEYSALNAAGFSGGVISGRVAYHFNFNGPTISVDTACSSSLVALSVGIRNMSYSFNMNSLVCGVNLLLSPSITLHFLASGMLTFDGRCKTLDSKADGYVRSEGCSSLMCTEQNGKATGKLVGILSGLVNQDGRSNGLTAPNGNAQSELLFSSFTSIECDKIESLQVQMHGTGTALGDPIESSSYHTLFHTKYKTFSAIFSAEKSINGHSEPASGLSSISTACENLFHENTPEIKHLSKGESVVSLQWGAWEDTGMAARNGITLHRAVLSGIGVVSPEAGLAVLDFVNNSLSGALVKKFNFPVLGAIPFSWYAIQNDRELNIKNLTFLREFRISMVFSALPDSFEAGEVIKRLEPKSKNKRSSDMDAERVINTCSNELDIAETVEGVISDILGRKISPSASLMEEGVDSLMAIDTVRILGEKCSLELPSTLIFDYCTISSISKHLYDLSTVNENLEEGNMCTTKFGSLSAIRNLVHETIYSILGREVEGETSLIEDGFDSLSAVELGNMLQKRLSIQIPSTLVFDYPRVEDITKFISNNINYIDQFDGIFNLSSAEVINMDPQQRLLLEVMHELQYKASPNINSNISITVGGWESSYHNICIQAQSNISQYANLDTLPSLLCGRISYTFGFKGPSVCVDTACSSSLVATQLAANTIISMESQIAYAGGVSLNIGLLSFQIGSAANMLSSDGRCKTLDIRADGYAKGECCGVMRITPDIETQSATIYVVAKLGGCGINQDGRSSSLTAPNGPSQQTLIVDVLKRANYNASGVDRLEMHGTGTSLGDPIEVGAALEVLVSSPKSMQTTSSVPFLSSQKRNLTLEGAKTRTGHCEPGAVTNALGRQILTDASLMDEGMDSLAAVELGSALQTATGTSMPATLAFDYPTIDAIVGFVAASSFKSVGSGVITLTLLTNLMFKLSKFYKLK
ncbi:unnamed protein product [Bathycoccus prasinos]